MPRPQNNRIVNKPPLFIEFKPIGAPAISLSKINLTLDEYEAIRLADYKGFNHEEAADQMHISRSTFSRLIVTARKKFADFMINGKILSIDGGNIHFSNNIIRCVDCGYMFKTKINKPLTNCPDCDSINLLNLAGGFGHGRCCVNTQKKRRQ
jgi:predicted DNA-binding protein (UPF0251 family)